MCVFFILMATCAEITIVMIYFQVRPSAHPSVGGHGLGWSI